MNHLKSNMLQLIQIASVEYEWIIVCNSVKLQQQTKTALCTGQQNWKVKSVLYNQKSIKLECQA